MFEKILKLITERGDTFAEFIENFLAGKAELLLKKMAPNNEEIPYSVLVDIYEKYPLSVLRFLLSQSKKRVKDFIFNRITEGEDKKIDNGNYYIVFENPFEFKDFLSAFFEYDSFWFRYLHHNLIKTDCAKDIRELVSPENRELIFYRDDINTCEFIRNEMYKLFKDDLDKQLHDAVSNYLGKKIIKEGNTYLVNITKIIDRLFLNLVKVLNDTDEDEFITFIWDDLIRGFIRSDAEITVDYDVINNKEKRKLLSVLVNNYISSYLSNKENERTVKGT
jgi:hypothetical protein